MPAEFSFRKILEPKEFAVRSTYILIDVDQLGSN